MEYHLKSYLGIPSTVKSKHDKFQHFHAQQLNFVHFMCEILESYFSAKS